MDDRAARRRLALTFAATRGAEAVPAARRLVTGNPVRVQVAALRGRSYRAPVAEEALRVLVVGGSQGARLFSEIVPAAIARLSKPERARSRSSSSAAPRTARVAAPTPGSASRRSSRRSSTTCPSA